MQKKDKPNIVHLVVTRALKKRLKFFYKLRKSYIKSKPFMHIAHVQSQLTRCLEFVRDDANI